MKNQKEAERAEQQRIKNLVLSYDPDSNMDQTGTDQQIYFDYFSQPNPNLSQQNTEFPILVPLAGNKIAHQAVSKGQGREKFNTPHHQHNASLHQASSNANAKPAEKASTPRGGHRARKLQLSDVDWYDQRPDSAQSLSRGPSHHGSHPYSRKIAG